MPHNKAIADEYIGGGDPSALVTGSSSKMFANERLGEKNKTKRKLEAERASKPKGVSGLLYDMQLLINAARADNDSFGSYMRTMFARGSHEGESAAEKSEKMAIEFRAREMNLQLIERMQKCLDSHKTPVQP